MFLIVIFIIILLGGGPMLFYLVVGFFALIASGIDSLFFKKGREKKQYDDDVNWFETHDFCDSLSPYIREYLKTGQLDSRFYEFDNQLADINESWYYGEHEQEMLREKKEVVKRYRELLINNLNNGKEYQTNKGKIRVVPIVTSGEYRQLLGWGRKEEELLSDDLINVSSMKKDRKNRQNVL